MLLIIYAIATHIFFTNILSMTGLPYLIAQIKESERTGNISDLSIGQLKLLFEFKHKDDIYLAYMMWRWYVGSEMYKYI